MKLEVKGLSFAYGGRLALDGVTFSVGEGEIVALVGPNGSGKTTLLKCIAGILKPKAGVISVKGKEVGKMSKGELSRLLAYVPQSTASAFPSTVFDAVLLGRKPYVNWGLSRRDKKVVSQVISLMGLEDLALRHLDELSGGERQKVFIARALAQEPEVLLLDEPTSNLDLRHQLEVMSLIRNLVKERRLSAIIAIHDLNLASRYADRVVMLNGGRIFAAGDPASVFTPENIAHVYGVEALVKNEDGMPYIVLMRPHKAADLRTGRDPQMAGLWLT